jgi:hypothetical protein
MLWIDNIWSFVLYNLVIAPLLLYLESFEPIITVQLAEGKVAWHSVSASLSIDL